MNTQEKIAEVIAESIAVKTNLLADNQLLAKLEKLALLCADAFKNGHKVFFAGNGGSAADAQHLAAEWSGRFYKNRKALFAEALHCNGSYLTAVGNDYGFGEIYARLVEGWLQKGDILILISTSGNSENILKAAKQAQTQSVFCVAWTGETGGELKNHCDMLINVPSRNTPRIQEAHILIGHILCELVENLLF